MTDFMDFNTAEKAASEVIPADTRAHILLSIKPGGKGPEGLYSESKNQLWFLDLECTVMGGPHDKRKFWPRLLIGSANGELTEGQQKGVDISRRTLRSIVEAMHKISSVDDSPAAMEKRKLRSLKTIDGIELEAIIGVEKSKDPQYNDKNNIKRIINPVKEERNTASAARGPAPANASAAPGRSKWG